MGNIESKTMKLQTSSVSKHVTDVKTFYNNDQNRKNFNITGSNIIKIKIIIFGIIILLNTNIQGQYYYTMFWNTQSLYNPAYSGTTQKYYGALIGRAEWLGFKGAPLTGTSIFDLKLDALHGGIGLNYTYEKIGFTTNNDVNANYCYHINLQHERILSIGISGGLTREKLDYSLFYFSPYDQNYDPLLTEQTENFTMINYKFGLFYKSKHWEAGLSSTHAKGSGFINYNIYWMVCSYRFYLGEDFSIKPNLLLRAYDLKNNSLSSGLLMMYKERFWAGISHTVDSSIGFMAGFDIFGQVRLGYSFDKSTISNYSNGNHEIIFAVMLK